MSQTAGWRRLVLPRSPARNYGAGVELEPDQVVEVLRGPLRTIAEAHRPPANAGLPEKHGVYAWWMTPGAISAVQGPSHPSEPYELLYVGISPKRASSKATVRSRIRGQHLGGNIGSSTFRQSLAALLFEQEGWRTRWSGSRTQLVPEHNYALSHWQREHLRVTWVERHQPPKVKGRVITLMQPPLNLAENKSHPLYHRLKAQRRKLRDTATNRP